MVTLDFDPNLLVNMELALESACHHSTARLIQHEDRKFIAASIIQCVELATVRWLG